MTTTVAAPVRGPTVAQIIAAREHATTAPSLPSQGTVASHTHPRGGRRFPHELIAELRGRLADYLTRVGVELKPQGSKFVGRCPMHDDRHPSFTVFGARHEMAGCFPCNFTGDVYAVAQWLGRAGSFPEAVADVAAVLGVMLPETSGGAVAGHQRSGTTSRRPMPPRPQAAKPIVLPALPPGFEDACTEARANLYRECVTKSSVALAVAGELGTDIETLRSLCFTSDGIGIEYARVRSARPVILYLYEHGAKIRHPKGYTPRFEWAHGSPALPWRWHFAARPEVVTVHVTEGETDAIAAISSGVENLHPHDGTRASAVIACPGTSFPEAWGPLFRGKRAVLMFDRDEPGQAAQARAAAIIAPYALAVNLFNWKGTSAR